MSDEKCTGLRFRGYESMYFDRKNMSFNKKDGFRLLKRKKCICQTCRYILEDIKDHGDDMIDCVHWNLTFEVDEIKNGAEYKLELIRWENEELPEFKMVELNE